MVQFHGESIPIGAGTDTEATSRVSGDTALSSSAPSDFRNIFGEPKEVNDLYRGVPRTEGGHQADRGKTRDLLAKLAKRMATAYKWDDSDGEFNERIPAGYTYLAQLAAHDLVQSTAPIAGIDGRVAARRNLRCERLILDTIYGGGPQVSPLAYKIGKSGADSRTLLRLGRVKSKSGDAEQGPFRDIPRISSCPFLNDARQDDKLRDVLIADPRNDDNFFISQLTAVFHMLHNAVYKQIVDIESDVAPRKGFKSDYERFLLTRRVCALVYRRVLRKDLLERLLNEEIYNLYDSGPTAFRFIDNTQDPRMPLEFSHAAYRVGHVMVRETYKVNDELKRMALEDGNLDIAKALRATSAHNPGRFPLRQSWLLRWSHFFPIQGLTGNESPQASRRIGPSVVYPLADRGGSLFGDHERTRLGSVDGLGTGLIYLDLVRGAEAGLRSVSSIRKKLGESLPSNIWNNYKHKFRSRVDKTRLGSWLNTSELTFESSEVDLLWKDPPLFFFVLLEAALLEEGKRIGLIGSAIIAEVFFAALEEGKAYIEEHEDVEFWAKKVFQNEIPRKMGEVFSHIGMRLV